MNETVDLLAARAPKLRKAARDARKRGSAYAVVDGTLIAIDRNKNWKIFRKLRCCPWRAGKLAKAVHALVIHA